MIKTRIGISHLVLTACMVSVACSPKGVIHPAGEDNYGCKEPPPDTFTSAGVDARVAESMFTKAITGSFDLKTYPSVVSLASQAGRDARINNYLQCLSIKRDGFKPAQVIYQQDTTAFLSTKPSPEEFMKWQQRHPFPVGSEEQIKILEGEVGKLREEMAKSSQELQALQERAKGRRLIESKRTDFLDALSNGEKGQIDVLFVALNSEAERFARDIVTGLKESGWVVTRFGPLLPTDGVPEGIRVAVKDPQMNSTLTLLSTLKRIGERVELNVNPSRGGPSTIFVGNKP